MVKWLNNKLLIVSGPTATGKTGLAIKLAKKFNGELISADSRQIYRGMDIGTGKDHPKNIKIHLIDIINPDQTFSAAEYRQLALEKIAEIKSKNKLPIIVGGTGFYIDAITNPQPTFSIKPNYLLRFLLNHFPLNLLQLTLKTLDYKTFNSLNHSDISNPHRLIRKIEIKLSHKSPLLKGDLEGFNLLHLSLTAKNDVIFKNIDLRIQQRLESGLLKEITNLLTKYKWSDPGLNCLAYKEFRPYFVETHDRASQYDKSIKRWQLDEYRYVRRQKTWFKKIPNVEFIDIIKQNYPNNVVSLVQKWYNKL